MQFIIFIQNPRVPFDWPKANLRKRQNAVQDPQQAKEVPFQRCAGMLCLNKKAQMKFVYCSQGDCPRRSIYNKTATTIYASIRKYFKIFLSVHLECLKKTSTRLCDADDFFWLCENCDTCYKCNKTSQFVSIRQILAMLMGYIQFLNAHFLFSFQY